ncbi:MAG: pyridoxal phosphate-dependent aminotransferase [Bdellovibrionota bacterium]
MNSLDDPFRIASRLSGVSESTTLKLNASIQAMRAAGMDIINLTAGEPDFAVHPLVKEAAIQAVRSDKSKYTPVPGIPELRDAIAAKTNKQQPSLVRIKPWTHGDVIVGNGGKQALFNAFMILLEHGDEVLMPSPYWLSYPEMVKVAGGVPRVIPTSTSSGFKMTPDQLEKALGPKVRIVILNSPSNPTGAVYSREELAALGKVLQKPRWSQTLIVSDEIYDRIVFEELGFCSFLEAVPELRDRTITVNGMSKSAAMTGWRVGWAIAPRPYVEAMTALQGQSTSGVNALAQWASVAALKLPDSEFVPQVESYRKRRNLALENLGKTSKLDIVVPQGAFYIFMGVGEDSVVFTERLLGEGMVALVPGSSFGEPNFVRLTFSIDEKSLAEGCRRIVRYLNR